MPTRDVNRTRPDDGWNLLGGVRFGLAIAVLSYHLPQTPLTGRNAVVLHLATLGGFPAVMGFLVLSGYAIAHSLAHRRDGFYARRFGRIYPLYLLAVAAGVAAEAVLGPIGRHEVRAAVANLGFLQTFYDHPIAGNGVLWTLSVEVGFYVIAPLLVRRSTPAVLGMIAGSAVAYAAYPRTGLAYFAALRLGLPSLFLGWAWLAGFAFYRVRRQWWAVVLLIVGTMVLTRVNPLNMSRHSTALLVGTLSALAAAASGRVRLLWPAGRVLSYAGDLSYPMYLFQGPVLVFYCTLHWGQSYWAVCGLVLAVSGVADVVDRLVRRPVTRAAERSGHLIRAWVSRPVRPATIGMAGDRE